MGTETGPDPREAEAAKLMQGIEKVTRPGGEQAEDPNLKLMQGIEQATRVGGSEAPKAEQGSADTYEVGQKVKADVRIGNLTMTRPCEIMGLAEAAPGLSGTYFKVKVDMGEGQPTIESVIRKEDIRK